METRSGKIIVLSAPSGTGKSTIIKRLSAYKDLKLGFSISATSRKPREGEADGREYYFISEDEFRRRIKAGEFVEWEEVYSGTLYGTLRSEITRITSVGKNLIMDIDVKGAINIKRLYSDRTLAIFISPPSLETLSQRLHDRRTDSEQTIRKRLEKAEYEMSFAPKFDTTVVNDDLDRAVETIHRLILDFIES